MSSIQHDNRWFFLIDCNQFFVSCEQVFNPKLKNKPVVVLSGHDGCIVARSREAKKLGIPMGAPAFQWKNTFEQHRVAVLPANHTLYGDLSARVMQCLWEECPELEVYSIDEAFLELTESDPCFLARKLKEKIAKWTGIGVSIGIAKTKTLAKLCSEVAKNHPEGIFWLPSCTDDFLKKFKPEEIWGIGKKTAEKLFKLGIHSVLNLKNCTLQWLECHFHAPLLKTFRELNEISCIDTEETPSTRSSILRSRSFGNTVDSIVDCKEALSCHIASAAETLREEQLLAGRIEIFLMTSRFIKEPIYIQKAISLSSPTQSTFELIEKAGVLLKEIFQKEMRVKKVGVILTDLCQEAGSQLDLFTPKKQTKQREKACAVLDQINKAFGKNSLFIGSQGTQRKWQQENHSSPRYTTHWDEILKIQI